MSEALVKLQKAVGKLEKEKSPKPALPKEEREALHRMRVEATDHGVALSDTILQNDILPSVALACMRRDLFHCAVHEDRCTGPMHVVSKYKVRHVWRHNNQPEHLITVCKAGTDAAREAR